MILFLGTFNLKTAMSVQWIYSLQRYSFAALIYEVHAAVGSVLFRFRSQYATLPRILVSDTQWQWGEAEFGHLFSENL